MFVGNTDEGTVVRIPVLPDGSADSPDVYIEDRQLVGADGLAFHVTGNLYVTTDGLGNSLVAVRPDRSTETLADASDGLDYAASIAFGTTRDQQDRLFIANVGASFERPSIMAADVGVAGVPLP
jgi:sugar lactone lactonase YvrE